MGYSMELESGTVAVGNCFFSPHLIESITSYRDEVLSMELADVSLNHFHLIHGKQTAEKDSNISIRFDTSFYVTHFVLSNTIKSQKHSSWAAALNTYRPYYQDQAQSEFGFIGERQDYEFFELAVQQSFFEQIIAEDGPHAEKLFDCFCREEYQAAHAFPIMPAMFQCIKDINANVFSGSLQQLFLETKSTELLLLQVQALMNIDTFASKLRTRDIACLHEAKLYIERNYQAPCSIIDLAKIVGINQTKLKSGFKELFGTTVFGYVRELQMQEARRLLLEEKCYVSEVADQVGYKQPQHFTAAFKRRFGILPSELK